MAKNMTSPDGAYSTGDTQFNIRKMTLKRTRNDGLTKIYIEVCQYEYKGIGEYTTTFKRQPTGVWVVPKNWNQDKQIIHDREPDVDYKRNKVEKVETAIRQFIASKGQQEPDQAYIEGVSIDSIREFFPARNENRKALVEFVGDYIQLRKNNKDPHGTVKEFKTLQNRLKAFDVWFGKNTFFDTIDFTWSENFALFLRNHAKNNRSDTPGYNEGTVEKSFTVLNTVLHHYYRKRDELNINLQDKFSQEGFKQGTKSQNMANPLTPVQRDLLYDHEFSEPYLQKTKDLFLLQCYLGLRYGDIHRIEKRMIKDGALNIEPHKTKRYKIKCQIPIHKKIECVLKKYEYDTRSLYITNQTYNKFLKKMFDKLLEKYDDDDLEWNPPYTSHNGRDTFISSLVQSGSDWKTILGFVGQSSYEIMDRYIKVPKKYEREQIDKAF